VQVVAGLVAGGAVGNLIVRIRMGYVIDFLVFHMGDCLGPHLMLRMRRSVSVWDGWF
jgi:lipoprotein signal peptidase